MTTSTMDTSEHSSSTGEDGSSHFSIKHEEDNQRESVKNEEELDRTAKWALIITALVIVMGAAAAACFVYMGVSSANDNQMVRFDRNAHDLSKEIMSSFGDYETAARWIHEACRNWRDGNFTREDFHVLYDYIVDEGRLDFFLAEWVPNITKEERPFLEIETAAYYAHDRNVNYTGFVGLEPNPENPDKMGIFPRSEQPFYFPIHFLEPYKRIGEAVHLDLYSLVDEQVAIDTAIQTFEPVLTERFVIVSQETHGYSVSLIHPGVPSPGGLDVQPRDLSLLLIHIRSLLERASRSQGVSLAIYIYDATHTIVDGSPQQFLGGAKIVTREDNEKELTYYSEVTIEEVRSRARLIYDEEIKVATRTWQVLILPVDDSYQPQLLFAILSGVMIFAASLLLAWIWIMHNRKHNDHVKKIITRGAAESAIVSSLFPDVVRDRLIEQNNSAIKKLPGSVLDTRLGSEAVKNVEGDTEHSDDNNTNNAVTSIGIFGSMPIAEFYNNTTIMFADLAGFTAWSSRRQPTEVFSLLETVYHEFDVIAHRRRVFKVETVGDCYVAVTGLPDPRKDHAVVMTRFANDCLKKVNKLLKSLQSTFGPDTASLGFRVGLHSGSVTAGVLRGQKGRFQLFGDTMNVASRMESTGEKNRIHVSQETADLLSAAGYENWLIPRQDVVRAKGKGTLQTYFVTTNGSSGSVAVNAAGELVHHGQDQNLESV